MYKRLLSKLEAAFRNGFGRRVWLQRLLSLLGVFFVVFSPNHSKAAIPVTKEQSILEKRIEIVRDNLKQGKTDQDKADTDLIASWNNWRNWGNY
jgi:hypothetical protein